MKKIKNIITLLLLMGLSILKVSANNVEYQTIQNNTEEKECMVFCEIPYNYSTTIPKDITNEETIIIVETNNNQKEEILITKPNNTNIVQTNDNNNFLLFSILFIVSIIGIYKILKKKE